VVVCPPRQLFYSFLDLEEREGRENVQIALVFNVAEPSNLMSPRSARLPLDTKHPRENTKLLGSIGHTPGENPKIHNFASGSQMRE